MELLSGFNHKRETFGVDARIEPNLFVLVFFRFDDKVSAVDQSVSITASIILACIPFAQDGKRIVLVRGSPPAALYGLDAASYGSSGEFPFHGMATVKGNQVIIGSPEIHGNGHQLVQPDGLTALIDEAGRSGDNVFFLKDAVIKNDGGFAFIIL